MKLKRISTVIAAAVISFTMAAPITVHADEWVKTDSGYMYEYDDGTTADKGWLTIGKDKYYIQKDGTRKTGWLKTTSAKYYFGKDGKMYKSKWLKLKDGTKYYLCSSGKAAVDCTIKISGKSYTFDENGKLVTKATTTKKKTDSASNSTKKSTSNSNKTTTSLSKSNSKTIYVTETGKRYHYDGTCNGGTYYKSTLEAAKDRGLTPCKKCVG